MALLERLHALTKSAPSRDVEGCKMLWLIAGDHEDGQIDLAYAVLVAFRQAKPFRVVFLHLVPCDGTSMMTWAASLVLADLKFDFVEEDDMLGLHFALDTQVCADFAERHCNKPYHNITASRLPFRPVAIDRVEAWLAFRMYVQRISGREHRQVDEQIDGRAGGDCGWREGEEQVECQGCIGGARVGYVVGLAHLA